MQASKSSMKHVTALSYCAVVGNDAGREFARNGPARRPIGRLRADLEVRPDILRHLLGCQVAHAMRQATLPRRARKANLDRLDDARVLIRGHQQRIIEPEPFYVLEETRSPVGYFVGSPPSCGAPWLQVIVKPQAAIPGSRLAPGRKRSAMPSTNRYVMSYSLKSPAA